MSSPLLLIFAAVFSYYHPLFLYYYILLQNKCDIEVAEKQQIKKVIKLLTLGINVSSRPKFQDDSTIEYDKKVYYSSLALKNLLECFINEEYMNNIGFEALKDNFNCLAYGKEVENMFKMIKEECGKLDVLVNNAGVCMLDKFIDMTDEVRDRHFDINIKGTWNVTKSVLPYMIDNNYGSIVNLSSVTGPMVADSGEVAYATTKAALIGFTKSMAMEYVDYNIRVNAILPGYILTPMVENMSKETNPSNPNLVIEQIESAIPMKRMGTIKELGELAAFLASDESSYITGSEFVIDGGSTLPETNSMGV